MNEEDKKELAKLLIPHLAWDLSRSSVYSFTQQALTTATSVEMLVAQVMQHIGSLIQRGESFTVAIIPEKRDEA